MRAALTALIAVILVMACAEPAQVRESRDWTIRWSGSFGRHDFTATVITNPHETTRPVTIAFLRPGCESTTMSMKVTNHHGKPVFDDRATCTPIRVPIPAKQLVTVELIGGRRGGGAFDVLLTLE